MAPKDGEIGIAKLTEAVSAQSIDLAISVSLFTHLDYAPALEMLTSIHQVLKNDGRVFMTVFVLDAGAMDGIEGRRTAFSFKHRTPTGKLYAEKSDDPTFAVAYDGGLLDELIGSAGFQLERRVRGYWSIGGPGRNVSRRLDPEEGLPRSSSQRRKVRTPLEEVVRDLAMPCQRAVSLRRAVIW